MLVLMAEREGFEPPDGFAINGFQDRRLKPLGHLSVKYVATLSYYRYWRVIFQYKSAKL